MVNPKSALLVALLTAGFAYQPYTPVAPSRASSQVAQLQVAGSRKVVTYDKELEVKDWPRETIYQSFLDKAASTDAAKSDSCAASGMPVCDFKFIVATVPDPQNSHYPVGFDRLVESIQRGFGYAHYNLDRFWLPWDSEPAPVDSDFLMHAQHKDWMEQRQAYPGVILFRPDNGGNERVCVFVIGENPVTGIHRTEFANAVSTINYFTPSLKQIAILGPSYSGSTTSLGIAITEANKDPSHNHSFNVVSGTTTDDKDATILTNIAGASTPGLTQLNGSDNIALTLFLNYAKKKTSSRHIAILSESGTSYAQNITDEVSKRDSEFLHFNYPMEISRLRNAYGNDPELGVLQGKADNTPHQGLTIQLKDEHESDDTIPTYSTELRPIAQEAAVLRVMASIARAQVDYVGVVASDILDSIFLGRLLKQHCPNTRAFILDSDLIYGHISQNNAFNGMLMVATYPLFHPPSEIDAPQFSSAIEEGEYLATIQLVKDVTNSSLVLPEHPDLNRPWLAVMGRDGIWPIEEPIRRKSSVLTPLTASLGWKVCFALASVFCCLFAGAIIYFNWDNKHDSLSIGWLSALRISPQNTLGIRITVTLACILLLAFYGFAAWLQFMYKPLAGWLVCLPVMTALTGAIVCCWTQKPVAHLVAPVVSILTCLAMNQPLPVSSTAFVYRCLHVSNGVSPIVPIVFLAIALFWLAWSNLNRLRLLHLFPPAFPALEQDIFLTATQVQVNRMKEVFGHWATGSYKWTASLIALLLFSLLVVSPARIISLEKFRFEWLYAAALYTLYFGLLIECTRFVRGWSSLHDMLRMLERHAICSAFSRLPNELSPSLMWRWGAGGQSFLVLAHFLKKLKSLSEHSDKSLFAGAVAANNSDFLALGGCIRQLVSLNSAAQLIPAVTVTTLNEKVRDVFSELAKSLSHHWGCVAEQKEHTAAVAAVSGGGTRVTIPHPLTRPLLSSNQELAEEIVALRFVDLIAHVNIQLKHTLEFIAGALILAVISLNSYPFEPHHALTSMLTVYFFTMSAVFLIVFFQMNRNTIISYLSDTTPGKLDGNIFHILSFGGLPLLAVISSQFPSIGNFLFAWVKPALETLR